MSELAQIGVVGAGTMGRGLSLFLPQHGFSVILITQREPILIDEQCERSLANLISRGLLSHAAVADIRSRFQITRDRQQLSSCRIVIECTAEQAVAKASVLSAISQICPSSILLASATSSLRISELAQHVRHRQRFIGLHFLNPVASTRLVEIARGPDSSASVVADAVSFIESLDKVPVVIEDSPGLIVNRLLLPLCNQALGLLEAGVADAPTIDSAMRLGCAHPIGPLELGDAIGWDIVLICLQNLHEATGDESYRPKSLMRRLVDKGLLGRKVGSGIYRYDNAGGKKLKPTERKDVIP